MKVIIKIIVGCFLISLMACEACPEVMVSECGGSETRPLIDLIILMDQSGSMGDAADAISKAAEAGISSALDECDSDLRAVYLGVDGVEFSGTLFTESHRNYINSIVTPNPALAVDRPPLSYSTEQGANAIEDLSNYFDWRPNACRSIFYISDEELDGCCTQSGLFAQVGIPANVSELANETNETNMAIAAANANNVAVFTHYINKGNLAPEILTLYQMLSEQTSGIYTTSIESDVNSEFYVGLFPEILCNSCNACGLNDFTN